MLSLQGRNLMAYYKWWGEGLHLCNLVWRLYFLKKIIQIEERKLQFGIYFPLKPAQIDYFDDEYDINDVNESNKNVNEQN